MANSTDTSNRSRKASNGSAKTATNNVEEESAEDEATKEDSSNTDDTSANDNGVNEDNNNTIEDEDVPAAADEEMTADASASSNVLPIVGIVVIALIAIGLLVMQVYSTRKRK